MKIIISEALISAHFLDRLQERLPKFISNNFKLKDKFNTNIDFIKNFTFPNGDFIVNLFKGNTIYLCGIVKHNLLITIYAKDKLVKDGCLSVYDIKKFKFEVEHVQSEQFPLGLWSYMYVDDGPPIYFIVKNRKIIQVVSKDNLLKFPNYKIYSID